MTGSRGSKLAVSSILVKIHKGLMLKMDLVGCRWNLEPCKHQQNYSILLIKIDQSSLQVDVITVVVKATGQQTAMLLVNNVVVLLHSQQELQLYLQLTLCPTHQPPPSKLHQGKLVVISRETEARDRNKLIFGPRYAQRMFNIHGWLTCTFDTACWAA